MRPTVTPTIGVFKQVLGFGALGEAETRQFLVQSASSIDQNPDVNYQSKVDLAQLIMTEEEKQIKENPLFETPYFDYGDYLEGIGLFDQAKVVFTEASKLSPNRQFPYMKLSEIAINQKDLTTAITDAKKAYDLDHTYPDAETLYVFALIKGNQFTVAQPLLADLVSNGNGLPQNIIQALVDSGNTDYAKTLLTNRLSANPTDQKAQTALTSLSQTKPTPVTPAK